MGKVTGFLEIDRSDRRYEPAGDRVRHFREFMIPLGEERPDASDGATFHLTTPAFAPQVSCLRFVLATKETRMDHPRISQDPKVMVGKPVIRGTRVTVELILRALGDGWSVEMILDQYPHLAREDILAAQAFAADYLSSLRTVAAE